MKRGREFRRGIGLESGPRIEDRASTVDLPSGTVIRKAPPQCFGFSRNRAAHKAYEHEKHACRRQDGIVEDFLRASGHILFLPSGCADLKDSNYEFYLGCPVPESAICLSGAERARLRLEMDFSGMLPMQDFEKQARVFPARLTAKTTGETAQEREECEFCFQHPFVDLAGSGFRSAPRRIQEFGEVATG
jgi:hypothetical protein